MLSPNTARSGSRSASPHCHAELRHLHKVSCEGSCWPKARSCVLILTILVGSTTLADARQLEQAERDLTVAAGSGRSPVNPADRALAHRLPGSPTVRWLDSERDVTSAMVIPNTTDGVVDYQSTRSALRLSRIFERDLPESGNGLGAGWRHTYDIMLTGQGDDRTVHDNDGRRWTFRVDPSGGTDHFAAERPDGGRLLQRGNTHLWLRDADWQYRFVGSWLVAIEHRHLPHRLSLFYRQRRLAQVTDENGEHLRFDYDGRQLASVQLPDDRTLLFSHGVDGVLDGQTAVGSTVAFANRSGRTQPAGAPDRLTRQYQYRDASGIADTRRPIDHCLPGPVSGHDTIGGTNDTVAGVPGSDSIDAHGSTDATDTDADLGHHDDGERPPADEQPQSCDAENNPPPPGFLAASPDPSIHRVDARPDSCQSYFVDYHGIIRGQAIEAGFEQHDRYIGFEATVNSFPIVDFITPDEWLVIKSRDLTSPFYNDPDDPDALYEMLMDDGQAIEAQLLAPLSETGYLEVSENGQTTRLTRDDAGNVVLEVVIQYGMATPAHREQIERAAAELQALYGIELRVIEIP